MTIHPIVGAWRLVKYEPQTPDASKRLPFGGCVSGSLIYAAEGFMSVAIMSGNRTNFTSDDRLAGTPDEYAQAMKTYVSYCGRYSADSDQVVHHIELSQFPNWSGTEEVRFYSIDGEWMHMHTPPFVLGGIEQIAHIVWQRAPDNGWKHRWAEHLVVV